MTDPSNLIWAAVFLVSGATGTFLLLPHRLGRVKPIQAHLVGFALFAVALVGFAMTWHPAGPFLSRVFFYLFGLASILGAVLTVTSKNPVHSALWFASVVLATSGLFLLAGAQFLAAGTVIVYAGAIIVTFLFVIMLAQMEGRATYDRMARSPFWATFSSFLILAGLAYTLLAIKPAMPRQVGPDSIDVRYGARPVPVVNRLKYPARLTPGHKLVLQRSVPTTSMLPGAMTGNPSVAGEHVAGLGAALYTEHLVTVELTGALLFAALIGALAIRHASGSDPPLDPLRRRERRSLIRPQVLSTEFAPTDPRDPPHARRRRLRLPDAPELPPDRRRVDGPGDDRVPVAPQPDRDVPLGRDDAPGDRADPGRLRPVSRDLVGAGLHDRDPHRGGLRSVDRPGPDPDPLQPAIVARRLALAGRSASPACRRRSTPSRGPRFTSSPMAPRLTRTDHRRGRAGSPDPGMGHPRD